MSPQKSKCLYIFLLLNFICDSWVTRKKYVDLLGRIILGSVILIKVENHWSIGLILLYADCCSSHDPYIIAGIIDYNL